MDRGINKVKGGIYHIVEEILIFLFFPFSFFYQSCIPVMYNRVVVQKEEEEKERYPDLFVVRYVQDAKMDGRMIYYTCFLLLYPYFYFLFFFFF